MTAAALQDQLGAREVVPRQPGHARATPVTQHDAQAHLKVVQQVPGFAQADRQDGHKGDQGHEEGQDAHDARGRHQAAATGRLVVGRGDESALGQGALVGVQAVVGLDVVPRPPKREAGDAGGGGHS